MSAGLDTRAAAGQLLRSVQHTEKPHGGKRVLSQPRCFARPPSDYVIRRSFTSRPVSRYLLTLLQRPVSFHAFARLFAWTDLVTTISHK